MKKIPENKLCHHSRWKCRVGFFHNETYGFTVHLLVGIDGPRLKRYCDYTFPKGAVDADESDDWCGRHVVTRFEDKSRSYEVHVIALQDFQPTPAWIAALVHETLHATQEVLDSRGLSLDSDTVEAYTYLQDWLVRKCLEMLAQKGRK